MLTNKTLCMLLSCTTVMPFGATAALAQSTVAQDAPREYRIGPGKLSSVLEQLGAQSGRAIRFEPRLVRGKRSRGVIGTLSTEQALEQALRDTRMRAIASDTDWAIAPQHAHHSYKDAYGDDIVVTATTFSATRAATRLRDIPQSVSVTSAEQIDKQNDRTLDDVLENATGITLLQGGSNINLPYARGFPVTSIHLDGGPSVGLINNSAQPFFGLPDLGEYDHVEILRGADALFGGNGNPGATVSLIRKEPQADARLVATGQVGSWNQFRGEIDATGPIALNGALKARVDLTYDRQDFYYDVANQKKWKLWGVVSYDIDPSTTVFVGGSYEHLDTIPFNGGLPRYPDGTDPGLPRSTSFALPWAYYDTRRAEIYGKLNRDFGGGWKLKADVSYLHSTLNATQVFFTAPVQPADNTIAGQPALNYTIDPGQQRQLLGSMTVTGNVDLLGMPVDVMLGADFVKYYGHSYSGYVQAFGPAGENIFTFNPADFTDPRGDPAIPLLLSRSRFNTLSWGLYGSFRFHLTDRLAVIGGGRRSADDNYSTLEPSYSFGGQIYPLAPQTVEFKDAKVTPFAGATWAVAKHLSAYVSYADIYTSSSGRRQFTGELVPPSDGINLEAGVKGTWFGDRLNASLALFKIRQDNLSMFDFAHLNSPIPNCCYLGAINNRSKGIELEISGKITQNWSITAGYTYNDNLTETNMGVASPLSSSTPRHLFKFWTSYRLPGRFDNWDIGATLQAQSSNYYESTFSTFDICGGTSGPHCPAGVVTVRETQSSYAVLGLRVGYRFGDHLDAALTVNNVFDKVYYSTIGIPLSSNTFGEPRNFVLKLRTHF